MKIAIEGCAHGELEKIYNTLQYLEKKDNIKIDLLICCGDFQSTRNLNDLRCMAVPPKYYNICTFYKYFSGELKAPYLTIFIGGNHEASNYLQELSYGGWVAPNIYYMGYASVINIAGLRIGGLSGIFKGFDFLKGHFERAPYNDSTKRSVYHIRNVETYRLKQLSKKIDIFLSHDWPRGIHCYGDCENLLKIKPFFQEDIESNKLGSAPAEELLKHLKPNYWFSAHLHCKFAAIVPHEDVDGKTTKFLALDKCLPKRKFLQVIDIPHDESEKIEIKYDLEWLTILHLTNHLASVKPVTQYMPGQGSTTRWIFTPTDEEKQLILDKFDGDLTVPLNFTPTAKAYNPADSNKSHIKQGVAQTNPQTQLFCAKLSIDDPMEQVLALTGDTSVDRSELSFNYSTDVSQSDFGSSSSLQFTPKSVELQNSRLNVTMPEVNAQVIDSPKTPKLSMTLPAPKHTFEDFTSDDFDSPIKDLSFHSPQATFTDNIVTTSTPQNKKFKRRNESIYNSDNCT